MATDFQALIDQHAGELKPRIPRATYRCQFNKDFTFRDAEALVPYLDVLGISDLYASPILRATPDSTHGYDITDPRELNPELGTRRDFDRLCAALRQRDMGLLLDIVPNHMGIGDDSNAWWLDVLENGPSSPYAAYFDIDWEPLKPELHGKVLLPLLGETYGKVLEAGQIKLGYKGGAFTLTFGARTLPVAPATYAAILQDPAAYLLLTLGESHPAVQEIQSILTAISYLPSRSESDPAKLAERLREKEVIKRRIAALVVSCAEAQRALENALVKFNGVVGEPQSFDALDALISAQNYRLAYWRVAAEEINYRRFFDINTMAAIHNELPEVFAATHSLIFELLARGQVTGLRIDHPDGLWNPPAYFRQLQETYVKRMILARLDEPLSANEEAELESAIAAWFDDRFRREGKFNWPLYIVAEKILSETEPLPLDWAVSGTTGYDFMNLANSLFVDNTDEAELTRIFAGFTGRTTSFSQMEYTSKKMIMQDALAGEINALAHRLERLSEHNRHTRDFTLNGLLTAVREIIACLPIYRTYITGVDTVSARDRRFIDEAVRDAKQRNPRLPEMVFDYVRDTLLLHNLDKVGEDGRRDLLDFVMRLQQISPPVMAKSVEDTLFYVYNRLVSVNEVGGSPAVFGITPEEFGAENMRRCQQWPHALLATSTHDTKRSEDVRSRLNVLSELVGAWGEALQTWSRANANYKQMLPSGPAPSANDEYLLYQALLGTFQQPQADDYADRIVDYMAKATKEAKVRTSWTNANVEYDQAVEGFVRAVLQDESFIAAFLPLQQRVAYFGQFNALGQTLLKLTCPGVPDLYRGTEIWDLSLVDPDNRRPVDYRRIGRLLRRLQSHKGDRAKLAADLLAKGDDGRIKLYVIQAALALRREQPRLFLDAPYRPVAARGEAAEHVCAFARVRAGAGVLVIVPRLVARLTGGELRPPLGEVWGETVLLLGEYAGRPARSLFTGEMVVLGERVLLADLLRRFPVGLFQFDAEGV